jgi:hypothetical protein
LPERPPPQLWQQNDDNKENNSSNGVHLNIGQKRLREDGERGNSDEDVTLVFDTKRQCAVMTTTATNTATPATTTADKMILQVGPPSELAISDTDSDSDYINDTIITQEGALPSAGHTVDAAYLATVATRKRQPTVTGNTAAAATAALAPAEKTHIAANRHNTIKNTNANNTNVKINANKRKRDGIIINTTISNSRSDTNRGSGTPMDALRNTSPPVPTPAQLQRAIYSAMEPRLASTEAAELLVKLLSMDPTKRITCAEALETASFVR